MAVPGQYIYMVAPLEFQANALEEVSFSTVNFSQELNAVGSFTGTVTIEEPLGTFNRVTLANLNPGSTAIWVLSDGVPVWGGIIWNIEADLEGRTVTVQADDFFSHLYRRLLTVDKTYTNLSQFLIVENLLDWANLVAGGDIGTSLDYTTSASTLRTKAYKATDINSIGELIEDLAKANGGFDWAIQYQGNNSDLQWFLRVDETRGRNTNLVFDTGKNVQLLNWSLDASNFVNTVQGYNTAEDVKIRTTRAIPLGVYPLLEEGIAFTEEQSLGELQAKTETYLQNRSLPIDSLTLNVDADDLDVGLGTFITGDVVRVVSKLGFVDIDKNYRIMSYTVRIDENDLDTMDIRMMDARLF